MNKLHLILIYTFLCLACHTLSASELRVGAYNLKNFGTTKAENTFVMNHLVQVLARYDIALLQEIRNKDQLAIFQLKEALEAYTGTRYSIIISEPIGRSSYKEQYAYLFNPSKVELLDFYVYEDGAEPFEDTFSREPFIAHFKDKASKTRFATIGAHIAPSFVAQELDEMIKVYQDINKKWRQNEVILMGDLNADCRYLDESEENNLLLHQDPRFEWQINRGVDSTTELNTFCAYDRIITTGKLGQAVVASQTGIYNLMEIFNLDEATANSISDHFPIEITFSF